jgi:hypothetical protein
MGLHKLTTMIMTGLLAGAALAADPPNGTKPPDESGAAQMQRAMQCLRIIPLQDQIVCSLNYRGLAVEIAAPDTPKRAIWIHAMGPNQSITNLGRRCVVVTLNDTDLQVDGQRAYVLIRDDAKFFTSTPAARKACG